MWLVRGLGKILLWTAAVAVVLAIALLVVNAVDEDLTPEVVAALKPVPANVSEQENGYFVIVGFSAPAGEDPHAHGRRWLAEVAAASPEQLRSLNARPQPEGLKFKGMRDRYCSPRTESCFDKVRGNAAEIRQLVETNAELLQRYESLYRYPRLEDALPARVDAPIPAFSPVLNAQSLKLGQIALMFEDGRVADAIAEIERDLALQRRFAAGSASLINLMIAQAALVNDYLFVADMLRAKRDALAPHAARIAAMLAPKDADAPRFERVLATEFRFSASMVRVSKREGLESAFGMKIGIVDALVGFDDVIIAGGGGRAYLDPLVLPFLKEQATINRFGSIYRRLAGLSKAPAGRLAGDYQAMLNETREDVINWRLAYNPVGKMLVFLGLRTAWPDYLYRVYDGDGLGRLVALQAQILERGIPDSGIPQILAASDKSLHDPYADKPMQWDAAARQLWFAPRSDKFRRDKIGGRADRVGIGL